MSIIVGRSIATIIDVDELRYGSQSPNQGNVPTE